MLLQLLTFTAVDRTALQEGVIYIKSMDKITGKVTLKASVHLQDGKRTEGKSTRKKSAEGAERGKIQR